MLTWLKWMIAPREMEELQRWRGEWNEHRRWFAEFPKVAKVLDRMKARVLDQRVDHIYEVRDAMRAPPNARGKRPTARAAGWRSA